MMPLVHIITAHIGIWEQQNPNTRCTAHITTSYLRITHGTLTKVRVRVVFTRYGCMVQVSVIAMEL